MLEPRERTYYRLRPLDCRKAIEPLVLSMLKGSSAPFLDFHSLLFAILPAAAAAGWEEDEIGAALESIVENYRPPTR